MRPCSEEGVQGGGLQRSAQSLCWRGHLRVCVHLLCLVPVHRRWLAPLHRDRGRKVIARELPSAFFWVNPQGCRMAALHSTRFTRALCKQHCQGRLAKMGVFVTAPPLARLVELQQILCPGLLRTSP